VRCAYNTDVPDFRIIPSIEQLRQRSRVTALEGDYGTAATVDALRRATENLRAAIGRGLESVTTEAASVAIETDVAIDLSTHLRGSLRPVINATGVVLHTNLGRAPLAEPALRRLHDVARGYSNLEYDLAQGRRGSRTIHAEGLLTAMTGAEAAVVVNNNAAAVLLILAGLSAGREVVVSRGELVEIGGGFRIPDVMRQSGATLREVGTTNRTRVADYRAAIGARTALLLRVHPSNFRVEGFTERPTLAELVGAAREAQIPVVEDLGSGCLLASLSWEPLVQSSIAAGVDLLCFSGDKLLGGPQSGLIVGKRALVDDLRRHPLMRALRVDKLTLAALEGTLLEYRAGRAAQTVPVARMLHAGAKQIDARAVALGARLRAPAWSVSRVPGASAVGGGSAPGVELPTVLLGLERPGVSADALEQQLRRLDPAVIARIEDDRLVLDLRTVLEWQDALLGDLLNQI